MRCSDPTCDYREINFTDPIVPALQLSDDVQGPIDFVLVIGTQASVYPAAGYIHAARLWTWSGTRTTSGGSGKGYLNC